MGRVVVRSVVAALLASAACAREPAATSTRTVELETWRVFSDSVFGFELGRASPVRVLPDSSLLVMGLKGRDALVQVSADGRRLTPRVRTGDGPGESRFIGAITPRPEGGWWALGVNGDRALALEADGTPSADVPQISPLPTITNPRQMASCDGGVLVSAISFAEMRGDIHVVRLHPSAPQRTIRPIGWIRRFQHVRAYPGVAWSSPRTGRVIQMDLPRARLSVLTSQCTAGDTIPLRSAWRHADSAKAEAAGQGVGAVEWVDDTTLALLGARRRARAKPLPTPPSDGKERPFDPVGYAKLMDATFEAMLEVIDVRTGASRGAIALPSGAYFFAGPEFLGATEDTDAGRQLRISRIRLH